MSMLICPISAQSASAKPTPLEQLMRAKAVSHGATSEPCCIADVHLGVFFDGTNNNKKRDQEDVSDPNARSHSNVVVLFDTYATKRPKHFRLYVPGVGTPFPEIGELGESTEGKAMARGGEARIHWGMIQVLNTIHQGALGNKLIEDDRAKSIINGTSFLGGKSLFSVSDGRRTGVFRGLALELAVKLRNVKPRIQTIHLSVFGFSRGAAQARTFCNWLTNVWETSVDRGGHLFDCMPKLRLQFVGLFGTVASVGIANSAPIPNDGGFMGWADGTLDLPASIERCVHFTAMHEIRKSFPLSTARKSACAVKEVMYPGAHSDVGGGHAPGEQGKAKTRAELLSQVPLLHMYSEARKAGVPLADFVELDSTGRGATINDLQLSAALAKRFDEYLNVGPKAGEIKGALREHLRWYWRWRLQAGERFTQLASYQAANAQHKEDLLASERDFQRDIAQAIRDREEIAYRKQRPAATAISDAGMARIGATATIPFLSEAESAVLSEKDAPKVVPSLVAELFDHHVHDSHASFYLVGPTTALDRRELVAAILEKQKRGEPLSGFERRVVELQSTRPGDTPTILDSDTTDLLARESLKSRLTLRLMTATRRESEGHVRERMIFDRS